MTAEGLPDIVIKTFAYYHQKLVDGETGLISESAIEPIESLPDFDELSPSLEAIGKAALAHTLVIKLNGGLGTSMGLEKAKSLLPVKNDFTFLDIIALQALDQGVPLVLMNSFNTQADSLAALRRHPRLSGSLPQDFLQHKVPKVLAADLSPADWTPDPPLAWAPPGHGDIYPAMLTSGILEKLLENGRRYAFVSNADNLGAYLDPLILGYFVSQNLPFMMEVTGRTPADRKGGHLARQPDGGFVLRELAQCPEKDIDRFQDITRHKYFNTNNLWLDLKAIRQALNERDGILGLPLIRNRKNLDPRDSDSPEIYQLETAMGAAIEMFPEAGALRVPRSRFSPVKTTEDLLALRSDLYVLTPDSRVVNNPERLLGPIVIKLDPAYYSRIDDLEARFPHGPPSLIACEQVTIHGDFRFGKGITFVGQVKLQNESSVQLQIADGARITGTT
jgi:UTP--glucose-1-phosphate uridylyltransferase